MRQKRPRGYWRRQDECFQCCTLAVNNSHYFFIQQLQYTHNLIFFFYMTLKRILHTWQAEQNKLLARGPDSGSQTSSVILNNPSRLLWEHRKGKPESIEIVSCLCNCLHLCHPKLRPGLQAAEEKQTPSSLRCIMKNKKVGLNNKNPVIF